MPGFVWPEQTKIIHYCTSEMLSPQKRSMLYLFASICCIINTRWNNCMNMFKTLSVKNPLVTLILEHDCSDWSEALVTNVKNTYAPGFGEGAFGFFLKKRPNTLSFMPDFPASVRSAFRANWETRSWAWCELPATTADIQHYTLDWLSGNKQSP